MRRFVIRETYDVLAEAITEAELKRRLSVIMCWGNDDRVDWDTCIDRLLHGEGEQATEPCYICHKAEGHEPFCSRAPQPADDEWERWVKIVASARSDLFHLYPFENENLKSAVDKLTKIIREYHELQMPRGK